MKKRSVKTKIIATVSAVAIAIPAFIYWDAAYKEVYYLCQNFKPGNERKDIIRQLNTAELSHYAISYDNGVTLIRLTSKLNFSIYKCDIRMDNQDVVLQVDYHKSGSVKADNSAIKL